MPDGVDAGGVTEGEVTVGVEAVGVAAELPGAVPGNGASFEGT